MSEQQIAVMIPIVLGLGVFLMIFGIRYLDNRERMAMIERGMDPGDLRRRSADPSRTLKNALMFIGAGTGLLLAIVISNSMNLRDESAAGVFFGLIAIFGGLGSLGAYLYERKNPPSDKID